MGNSISDCQEFESDEYTMIDYQNFGANGTYSISDYQEFESDGLDITLPSGWYEAYATCGGKMNGTISPVDEPDVDWYDDINYTAVVDWYEFEVYNEDGEKVNLSGDEYQQVDKMVKEWADDVVKYAEYDCSY